MRIISVIPARGGSKRLAGKNIRTLASKPLLGYTIEHALNAECIDRTFVSTECTPIADVARSFGAEVIKRPDHLATDESLTYSAIDHVIRHLEARENYIADVVIVLQPTCPFRPAGWIDQAFKRFCESDGDSLISVTESKLKVGVIRDNLFFPEYQEGMRKQDISPKFRENGLLYISKCTVIKQKKCLFGNKIIPFIVDKPWALINIDTQSDFNLAEYFISDYLSHLET